MSKLSLVIADVDEAYVESMVDFLASNHSKRFQISSFTREDFLGKHLTQSAKKIDILLISPELYDDSIPREKIGALIVLSSGRFQTEIKDSVSINKYQQADKIASDIINIFTEKNKSEIVLASGSKSTKVVCVYSPVGGAGKTSIAVGASIQCAQNGLSVFYLNLENFDSGHAYFKCNRDQNLSHIFYYIKEKNKNLSLKIEGTRCIDPEFNVHYFLPPDSAQEIDEILPEELKTLVCQLRSMSQYDVVFIDMSSSLTGQNLALLDACDEICLVLTQDTTGNEKFQALLKELNIVSRKYKLVLNEKIKIVLNKYNYNIPLELDGLDAIGWEIAVRLPLIQAMMTPTQRISSMIDLNNGFGSGINELISSI